MTQRHQMMTFLLAASMLAGPAGAQRVAQKEFATPPAGYRPTIALDEGAGYAATFEQAAARAMEELDAGGVMFNPQGDPARRRPFDAASLARLPVGLLDSYPAHATPWLPKALPGEARFGTYLADGRGGPGKPSSLGYMTPAWFAAMRHVLDRARAKGLDATFYDEAGFPSGSADNNVPARFYRKVLRRSEATVSGFQRYELDLAGAAPVAVVAFNPASGERIDLLATAAQHRISWQAPYGNWRVQRFDIETMTAKGTAPDYFAMADPLDAEATRWFIGAAYDRVYQGLARYFGSTVKVSFFDDVGIFNEEKTWHPAIAALFEKMTGKSAALYYPALWGDIGPETAAARVGFFKARSELLGQTFPKLITDWAHAHGIRSTGHAPGNYDLQPTDTVGDPFKFYAHTDIPMADVLWGVGFARGGFKLISSVSAQRDLPETMAEAFSVDNDANGYRRMIELFVRGYNRFVTGARVPSKPLGTGADFNRWAGRSSYLLRGGRQVADIAVLFPIESLQAYYSFNAPANSTDLPSGTYAYRDADYQAVGEMLLTGLHRDFTFVHPDALGGDKVQVKGRALELTNKVNFQRYRVIVMPGGEVLSLAALAKIKAFWDAGGNVIATSLLPSRSAEFGKDAEVRRLVAAMFGSPEQAGEGAEIRRSAAGGQALFLARPSVEALGKALDRLGIAPDVALAGQPRPTSGNGVLGYTHRVRDGKQIYYFGNSSDTAVDTMVTLRGHLVGAQLWNPHDGKVTPIAGVRYRTTTAGAVTEFRMAIAPVSSLAVVARER